MSRFSFTEEKLFQIVETLATHPGDSRERVASTWLTQMELKVGDFPAELQQDWMWVQKEMRKYGPLRDALGRQIESDVEHTMRRVKRGTGCKIAKRLFDLYWAICERVVDGEAWATDD